jgi:hypothetical protein
VKRDTNDRQSIFLSYGRFFAEFLNEGSLVHLRLLAQSTCVGFSTVSILLTLEAFPGTLLILVPLTCARVPETSWNIARGICLPDFLNAPTEIQ